MKQSLFLFSLVLATAGLITGCSSTSTKRSIASASFLISNHGVAHRLGNNSSDTASDCGGMVTVKGNDDRNLQLVFESVDQCKTAELRRNGSTVKEKSLDGNQGSYHGVINTNLDELNSSSLYIHSNNENHNNTVRFSLAARNSAPPSQGDNNAPSNVELSRFYSKDETGKSLPYCGGTVKMTKSTQGNGEQVNIVFKGVTNCSKFEFLRDNGVRLDDNVKTLGGSNGNYSGSFTVPGAVLDIYTREHIKVIIKNASDGTPYDTIGLNFVVLPSSPPSPPQPDYNGGGGSGY